MQLAGENGIAFEARAKSFFPSVVAVEIVAAQHFIELKRNISKQFECASPKIIFHFVGNLLNRKMYAFPIHGRLSISTNIASFFLQNLDFSIFIQTFSQLYDVMD